MATRLAGLPLRLIVLAGAVSGSGLVAQADQDSKPTASAGVNPLALEALAVRTSAGVERFYIEDADAATSAAWRDEADCADKAGAIPEPRCGFELTSRVIVRAADAEALSGTVVEPLGAARGFWVVSGVSIREAAALADELADREGVAEVYLDLGRPRVLRTVPTDPYFPDQWHLKNELDPLFDVNAEPGWDAGYTGSGVVIGIVELAWQSDHPDLAANYNAEASQVGGTVTAHATSCAGVAAAAANNDLMGAGMAYGAQISSQIYGTETEITEALAYRNDLNDIKSNSWGPADIGWVFEMPSVVRAAIEESVADGRGGLGEVFVWAAGNGGSNNDRVDYDPYASSRFTIAVGAIGDADVRATYNERGSSMLVVAQSSGNGRGIHTTTSGSGWTTNFGGTSAASPLAAGVVALMLEANPGLTWRDVQHVLIESARKNDPNDLDWITNGAGYEVSYDYGFGAVDAGAAAVLAESWLNVPHELVVDTNVVPVSTAIPDNDPNGVRVTATVLDNIRIETVELILNVVTTSVGDLEIVLTGPSGTESVLAKLRSDPQDDYLDYRFTSMRHWGEESAGDWTIAIADRAAGDLATWDDYRLVFYGTPTCPGDLNEDGVIGLSDLAALVGYMYGTCEGDAGFEPAADFDNSGCVDLSDLADLIGVYGQSCE